MTAPRGQTRLGPRPSELIAWERASPGLRGPATDQRRGRADLAAPFGSTAGLGPTAGRSDRNDHERGQFVPGLVEPSAPTPTRPGPFAATRPNPETAPRPDPCRSHGGGRRAPALGYLNQFSGLGHEASCSSHRGPRYGRTSGRPGRFSPGACVSFPPTAGARHQTVFVDAGPGGINPGAVGVTESGHTIHEADLTLPVELDATALLRAQGFTVVVSRTAASSVVQLGPDDLSAGALSVQGVHDDAARDLCANLAHAALLIGIYFDAGPTPQDAGSVTAYDAARPFAQANLRLAGLVQPDVLAALNAHGWGVPDDGVVSDVSLGRTALTGAAAAYSHLLLLGPALAGYFSTPSQMPMALIEPLFITDPFEGAIAASVAGQHAIASGLDQAVQQYFMPPPTSRPSAA